MRINQFRTAHIGRLCLGTIAFVGLTGFVQIQDEALIDSSGGSVMRRKVSLSSPEKLIELLPDISQPKPKLTPSLQTLSDVSLCAEFTKQPIGWDNCRFEGTTLILEKSYSAQKSPFSSSGDYESSDVTFALHRWFSNPIMKLPVELHGVSLPVALHDEAGQEIIRNLQASGSVYKLTVRMPGKIKWLWGKTIAHGSTTTVINLLEPQTDESNEYYILSEPDLLHSLLYSKWVHLLLFFVCVYTALGLARKVLRPS
jgi:hypothetical protein